jgi:AraC family transcriptional regulator, regulatory protein of adaptative response / methylated-DNA-[protein]-cysteine methyltransferase
MHTLPPFAEMERASSARDASYDGLFFVAVKTTGIFCRPSCPARKPLPHNVEYVPSVSTAMFAGYRPCKRCHPLEASGELPAWAAALVAEIEADPAIPLKDARLRERGLDPATVRRFFQGRFGMTFHAYRRAHRLGRAFQTIRQGGEVTGVGVEVGFESESGFRDAFARFFGQPPGRGRAAGNVTIAWLPTPVGPLLGGATDEGVCLVEFTDRRAIEVQLDTLGRHFGRPLSPGRHPHLERLAVELGEYFAGSRRHFAVPLQYPGSVFQRQVWDELLRIPYGETRSYEDLAVALGKPGASRAVGHANGLNRIAILIPCHRVVAKDGSLGGYGGGLWRKRFLLDLERGSGPSRRGDD